MTEASEKPLPPTDIVESNHEIPRIPVVGVGASAGGLDAFKNLFQNMPTDTGIAFVLVQHLDPTHESMMVDLLSRFTDMTVVQVTDAMVVAPNHIYMIPPNKDLTINNGELFISAPARPRGLRLPIDSFFCSLAEDQRERASCIVLSGTGSDGTLGLKAIKSYGGMAMVQAPDDAQYDGMPVSAVSTGIVDYVLPVNKMAEVLVKYIQHSYIRGFFGTEIKDSEETSPSFNSILAIIRTQLGHDLHAYKRNTLIRRIKRRISLKQLDNMEEYVLYLREHPDETVELFKDMLIGVTSFFRDPDSWKVLETNFLQALDKDKTHSLRIWVPGCSTGEEAYSMAIQLLEYKQTHHLNLDFQIFATDIDINALEIARTGIYPESIAASLTAKRLDRYFRHEDEFYKVNSALRDSIVFSEQNLISDPPFSKLDLISCRNLLIYLQSGIQGKIMDLFHFALKPDGSLLLGSSETIGQQIDLFGVVSKKWRLFKKINSGHRTRDCFPIIPEKRSWHRTVDISHGIRQPVVHISDLANKAMRAEYVPACIVINRKHQVLYYSGDTGDFLQPPSGAATDDLFSLLREGLITRVRGAVHKAIRGNEIIRVNGARVKRSGHFELVKFRVKPLSDFEGGEGILLIGFEDERKRHDAVAGIVAQMDDDEPIVKQLEHELNATKEDLQNTIEELETSNEELKASNEEVMSMNEELQSSNEELETSKEELQSLNEELNTVNNELQDKVGILETSANDLTNLINSTSVAAIFLDTQFHINFFSPAAKSLFHFIATDIGRSLHDITARFSDPDLQLDGESVLDTLRVQEKEVKNDAGEWFMRKILPYRTHDNRIEGIVITFEEITRLKHSQLDTEERVAQQTKQLHQQKELLLSMFSSIHVMTTRLDADLNIIQANDLFLENYGCGLECLTGKDCVNISQCSGMSSEVFQRAQKTGEVHFIFSTPYLPDGHPNHARLGDWVIKPLKDEHGKVQELLLSIVDVTERDHEIKQPTL